MKGLTASFFTLCFCLFSFCSPVTCAGEDSEEWPPPGMKIEKVGDLNIVVPKDAEVERTGKGGLIKVEKSEEYLARKLLGMEERFDELEAVQKELIKEIELLKEEVDKLKAKNLTSR